MWGTVRAADSGVPPATGALAGVLAEARTGVSELRSAVGAAMVLVGHRCVVVLVGLVELGGKATVVVGEGRMAWVTCCNDELACRGAVRRDAFDVAPLLWGAEVVLSESIATTTVAVTRGAATTLVARWWIKPRLSCRTAWRGVDSRIRLNTAAPCERVSHVPLVHHKEPLRPSPWLARAEDPWRFGVLGKQSALPMRRGPY